jgi:hypothetical protein
MNPRGEIMKYGVLLFLFILAGMQTIALAEDINGEWLIENTDTKTEKVKTTFEFQTRGTELTGSMLGYPDSEMPILDGKISGDKVTFSVKEPLGRQLVTFMYIGKISNDVIKFEKIALGGHGIAPNKKYIAKRAVPPPAGK